MLNSSSTAAMKVGIVDDSPLVRAIIKDVVSSAPGMEVVGEAEDPYKAREMIKDTEPDVITLDIEMPKMNGIEFLEKVMRLRPMPVIMVSTLTQKGADITVQALEMGAMDYVAKPLDQGNAEQLVSVFKHDLVKKLKQVKALNGNISQRLAYQNEKTQPAKGHNAEYDLIAIASSTGGIERLRFLISKISCNMPPITIVQHINERYVPNLVSRIQSMAPDHIKVKMVEDQEFLRPNTVYFADNNRHLTLQHVGNKYQVMLVDDPPLNGFVASADYMFQSLSKSNAKRTLGIIISGMGNDGADGLLAMKGRGAKTVGENKESCLVYGMSQAAAKIGAIDEEMSIQNILKLLNNERVVS